MSEQQGVPELTEALHQIAVMLDPAKDRHGPLTPREQSIYETVCEALGWPVPDWEDVAADDRERRPGDVETLARERRVAEIERVLPWLRCVEMRFGDAKAADDSNDDELEAWWDDTLGMLRDAIAVLAADAPGRPGEEGQGQ